MLVRRAIVYIGPEPHRKISALGRRERSTFAE